MVAYTDKVELTGDPSGQAREEAWGLLGIICPKGNCIRKAGVLKSLVDREQSCLWNEAQQ